MPADGDRPDPIEALMDLLVYAPIGLVLDAETVAPDLARRGRQHTAAARQIGELAVKAGLRRLEALLDQAPPKGESAADDAGTPGPPQQVVATRYVDAISATSSATDGAELPIADYDSLAASQIVQRLDALSPDELEAIRSHESSNRGRRTILSKLARLQA